MMKCSEVRANIELLIDDALSPGIKSAMQRHISKCGHCSEEFHSAGRFRLALRRAVKNSAPAPEHLLNNIRRMIRLNADHH